VAGIALLRESHGTQPFYGDFGEAVGGACYEVLGRRHDRGYRVQLLQVRSEAGLLGPEDLVWPTIEVAHDGRFLGIVDLDRVRAEVGENLNVVSRHMLSHETLEARARRLWLHLAEGWVGVYPPTTKQVRYSSQIESVDYVGTVDSYPVPCPSGSGRCVELIAEYHQDESQASAFVEAQRHSEQELKAVGLPPTARLQRVTHRWRASLLAELTTLLPVTLEEAHQEEIAFRADKARLLQRRSITRVWSFDWREERSGEREHLPACRKGERKQLRIVRRR
jgi:hypothetical protein